MRFSKLFFVSAWMLCGTMAAASSSVMIPNNPAAAATDENFQNAVQALPDDERDLLSQYMVRSTLGAAFGGIPSGGLTIAEAIAKQRAFQDKKVAEKNAEEAAAEALAGSVAIEDIRVEKTAESRYRGDTVKVSARVKNLSDRPIAGVKILVEANDIFGDRLGSYGLKSDSTIQPQGEITLTGHYDGSKVLKADQSKVSVSAEPIHIVFEDRSELKSSRRIIGF